MQKKYEHILVDHEKSHGVLTLTLNRMESSNALNLKMIEEIVSVIEFAELCDEVKVVIVGANGKNFCAGGDVKAMREEKDMFEGNVEKLRLIYQRGIQKIPLAIEALNKPIIAMVDGAAIGAGCDLAAMCDMRIGSPNARFGETFAKLSLVPGDGGTYFLLRAVGYAKTMEMLLTGKIYSAEEALSMGLLNRIVPAIKLKEETFLLACELSMNVNTALAMSKRALKLAFHQTLPEQLELLATYQAVVQRGDDHKRRIAKL